MISFLLTTFCSGRGGREAGQSGEGNREEGAGGVRAMFGSDNRVRQQEQENDWRSIMTKVAA